MSNVGISKLSPEQQADLIKKLSEGVSHRAIAREFDVSRGTVSGYAKKYLQDGKAKPDFLENVKQAKAKELAETMTTFSQIFEKMDEEITTNRKTEDLIDLLVQESQKKIAADTAKKNFNVNVKIDGPVGISFFGDPHLDNEGCDWLALKNDVQLVKQTEGMFAANIGDTTDNWVGRLAKFYQHQKISRSEALQLTEWLFKELPWLFIVFGNHDHWNSDTGNVLDYIMKIAEVPGYKVEHDARFNLHFPNGNIATVRARHNFAGKSAMNPVHGMVKETQLNLKDDILVCGDWHHSGYQPIWYNEGGKGHAMGGPILCHAIRLGTYKRVDSYAAECGFKDENWSPNMVAIIDPYTNNPVDKVKIEYSVEAGADRLTWMRNKYAGKNKTVHVIKSSKKSKK